MRGKATRNEAPFKTEAQTRDVQDEVPLGAMARIRAVQVQGDGARIDGHHLTSVPTQVPHQVQVARDQRHFAADAADADIWEAPDLKRVKATIKIRYVDIQGQTTVRIVDVTHFGQGAHGWLFAGHCRLREDRRTFRIDRVQACLDMTTGEQVSDMLGLLQAKFDRDPDRAIDRLRVSELDTLKVLFFLGKADGQLRAAERTIIYRTVLALAADSQLTESGIENVIRDLGLPSLHAFKLAVGILSKRDHAARAAIVDAAQRMVATQKTATPAEADALKYIETRLAPPMK